MENLLKACHTTHELKYHFVWIVKYRKDILFDKNIDKKVREIFEEIGKRYWFEVLEIGTDGNHLHAFIQAAPRYAPANIAQIFKSISAKELFKNFPYIKQELWGGQFWGDGYFVRSVGTEATTESIRIYIQRQGQETGHKDVKQLRLF